MEPVWLLNPVVTAMHERLLAEHGGATGVRDSALLESALARPKQLFAYGEPDIFDLAAAYLAGIVRNHPFVDGNKRTGFMCAYVFLMRNGQKMAATEPEAAQMVIDLAAGDVDETSLAEWLRGVCESIE